ncbi:kinase-like protein [Auriculariales sp. MPI-PUGE-AT-0066]|nr:kinase-like protein [Auriculariales sp. MPI-PUGE-AT-0066]
MSNNSRHSFTALNTTFVVDANYIFVKELGTGAYGSVVAAKHRVTAQGIAIKRISSISSKRSSQSVVCVSSSPLLHHFRGHKNVRHRLERSGDFDEVYCYEELMEADLHAIIRSGQPLSDAHFQSFIYQTLCGLKYIHSANVLHRDLKPGNLLVNADCELKICDFGLARSDSSNSPGAAHWYRAPEIMLSYANYTTSIDVWSVGCILAELLGGKPIFKGRDYVDQLNQILHLLGTPTEDTLRRVGSPRAQDYIRSLPIKPRVPFSTLYPHANPLALELLAQLLHFDPAKRVSAEQALAHPYLAVWHDPNDEPICPAKFDFSFEEEESMDGMKRLIVQEVEEFRDVVRRGRRGAGNARRKDSLPIPTRDEIMSTPTDHAPANGFARAPSPVVDDPSRELERELSGRPVQVA